MTEFFQTINALSWPGAFALVGIAASLAYWFKGHPDASECADEDEMRRIVREEIHLFKLAAVKDMEAK